MDGEPVSKSRLKSLVWNDFERVKKGDVMAAICKHCKKRLSASATSGTSHLKNHLNRCRKRNIRDIGQQVLVVRGRQSFKFEHEQIPLDFKFNQHRSRFDFRFDQDQSRFDLARMIILHEYPLSIVEHIGFKKFVENLQPLFQLTSCNGVKSDCLQIYSKEKQKVYEMLDKVLGKISLTVDIWGSHQDLEYLCLTAHFFDEAWVLQKKILSFVMVDPRSEQSLSDVIMTCLMDWDIDRKLFSMTVDNCSTNDVIYKVRDRLSQNRLLPHNGQLFHVCCAGNTVHLIVQDVLESIQELTQKIRESVRYVRCSEEMPQKFNEVAQNFPSQTRRNLCLDCPTLWKSTLDMLEAALEYKDVFTHLQQCDPEYTLALSDIEWGVINTVCSYLKFFVEVTGRLSSIATANDYFVELCQVHLQLLKWCDDSDMFINSVVLKMKNRLDTYWCVCGQVLAISAILDPRYKMKLIKFFYDEIYSDTASDVINDVSNGIKELYNEYVTHSTLTSVDHGLASEVRNCDGLNCALPNNDTSDRLIGYDKYLHDTSDPLHVKSELDKYLEEPVFPRKVDFNIVSWWRVNAPKYPILTIMARDVLGIPMSTVEPELAFNLGGKVLDPYRCSLNSDILQALICTHDWWRKELEVNEPVSSHSGLTLCFVPDANV